MPLTPDASHGLAHPTTFAVTLMEHLVVPTFVIDAERRVQVWNKACERLTGLPAAEVIGTRDHWRAFYDMPRPCLADLVANNDMAAVAALYTTHDDPGTPALGVHAENWCPMPRRCGESRYLVVDAGPVFDDAGALIAVVETLRDFTESKQVQVRAEEQAVLLRHHYEEHQREAEMARRILDHQIRSDLTRQAGVHFSVMPATHFSGDLVLAARAPDGRLFAVLADATGHGLAAAVSVLPLVQEFYRLVAQGVSLAALVESIGFILGKSLPVGRFVAGAFVCLDGARGMGEIWCGGISDVYLLEESGLRHFESRHVPMGVNPGDATQVDIESFVWRHPARLVMVSDGAVEASDSQGQAFGQERLLSVLQRQQEGDLIASVRAALDEHLDGAAAHDDISVVVIDCPAPL